MTDAVGSLKPLRDCADWVQQDGTGTASSLESMPKAADCYTQGMYERLFEWGSMWRHRQSDARTRHGDLTGVVYGESKLAS